MGSWSLIGAEFPFGEDEEVLGMDGGMAAQQCEHP